MNKNINIGGKKIFYRVYGEGKPVVLLHGFGETGDIWQNQIEFLKGRFQLIVPDLPGSGQSEMIDDISIEGMAEVIKLIIDTNQKEIAIISGSPKVSPTGGDLEGAGVALIGHSMGGYITLAFAEKYGSYLHSFGLFHSSAFADTEEKIATRRKGIDFIKEHGAYEFLKTAIPKLFAPNHPDQSEIAKTREELIEKAHNFSDGALVSYYDSMINRPDRTKILKNASVPVLFVMGKYDNAIPLEDGLKQCFLPEKSYIHVLSASGHMGMLEEPGKSNRLLEEFLSTS